MVSFLLAADFFHLQDEIPTLTHNLSEDKIGNTIEQSGEKSLTHIVSDMTNWKYHAKNGCQIVWNWNPGPGVNIHTSLPSYPPQTNIYTTARRILSSLPLSDQIVDE